MVNSRKILSFGFYPQLVPFYSLFFVFVVVDICFYLFFFPLLYSIFGY